MYYYDSASQSHVTSCGRVQETLRITGSTGEEGLDGDVENSENVSHPVCRMVSDTWDSYQFWCTMFLRQELLRGRRPKCRESNLAKLKSSGGGAFGVWRNNRTLCNEFERSLDGIMCI